MPSGLLSDGRWLCKPCDRSFASYEALFDHKQQMRQTGQPRHIHCKHCGQDFKTERAEIFHIHTVGAAPSKDASPSVANKEQFHAKEQNLTCVACGQGPFARIAGLIAHIERGSCAGLNTSVIDQRREKQTDFSRKLEILTKEPVKNSFAKYTSPSHASSVNDLNSVAGGYRRPSEVSYPGSAVVTPDRVPGSEAMTDRLVSLSPVERTEDVSPVRDPDNVPNIDTLDQVPEPQHAATENAVSSQAESVLGSEVFDSMDPDHPGHPAFRAATYWSPYAERYLCPKLPCGKVFKSASGLISHLQSPAHGLRTYQCPYCLKRFKSLTAIVSHAEQSSIHCRIRDSDSYDAFVHQLTAGIVDVGKDRHEDGTISYETAGMW